MRFDVSLFVAECVAALDDESPQLVVRDIVARAVSTSSSLEEALGQPSQRRITPLFRSETMTVMHFVWPPTVDLFPHEHQMWSTVGIYGGVETNRYWRRVSNGRIEVAGHAEGRVGDVLLMGSDGIHSVQNRTRQWTAAIHVYGGDFFANPRLQWDRDTLESEPFDVANATAELQLAEERAVALGIRP